MTAGRPPRLKSSGSKASGSALQVGPAMGEGFDPQELLTPDEVCALLKMKRTWFYAEVARGALRPLKLRRSTRVRRRDLEAILAGRPGSWEVDGVRNLLTGTVGCDEQQLHEHRTEPVVVNMNVDNIMFALEVWQAYDEAATALQRRYDDLGVASWPGSSGDAPEDLSPVTPEQEQQLDEIAALDHQHEQQRQHDWAAYSTALKTYIGAQVPQIEGLRVPLLVTIDSEAVSVNSASGTWGSGLGEPLADRLLNAAIDATPPPGKGKSPLKRLTDHAGEGCRVPWPQRYWSLTRPPTGPGGPSSRCTRPPPASFTVAGNRSGSALRRASVSSTRVIPAATCPGASPTATLSTAPCRSFTCGAPHERSA